MRLLVATTNKNKLLEIRRVLAGLELELLTLDAVPPVEEPDESATSFWENARLKAFAYAHAAQQQERNSDLIVVAEDSGLEISGLGGAPGVHSARFMGANVAYTDRFAEIFRRLEGQPRHARSARFVTALAAVRGREVLFETEASIDGVVHTHAAGTHGFGYDPIFYYAPMRKTTAELTLDEKSIVSHRARAFRDFARWLRHTELA